MARPRIKVLDKAPVSGEPAPRGAAAVESWGPADRESGVQVLARAAEILRLLKNNPGGLTQAEIANRLGLARTTVHRIMNALATEELVQHSGASSRYRLGQEILQMANAMRNALIIEIHPLLESLSRKIEETVDLAVIERNHITFVDQVVAPHRLRAVSAVGASFPLHCSAPGKALLAELQPAEVNRMLPEELASHTPHTITSLKRLQKELAVVRESRVAYDREEYSVGICAIGMALRDTPLGAAAISIPMPVQRFDQKKTAALAALRETVAHIETTFAEYSGEGKG